MKQNIVQLKETLKKQNEHENLMIENEGLKKDILEFKETLKKQNEYENILMIGIIELEKNLTKQYENDIDFLRQNVRELENHNEKLTTEIEKLKVLNFILVVLLFFVVIFSVIQLTKSVIIYLK